MPHQLNDSIRNDIVHPSHAVLGASFLNVRLIAPVLKLSEVVLRNLLVPLLKYNLLQVRAHNLILLHVFRNKTVKC